MQPGDQTLIKQGRKKESRVKRAGHRKVFKKGKRGPEGAGGKIQEKREGYLLIQKNLYLKEEKKLTTLRARKGLEGMQVLPRL